MIHKYITSLFLKTTHGKTFPQEDEQYILLTYRSGIEPVQKSTYYTSDAGWGCMLRVGQMFIANVLYKIQNLNKKAVVQLFYDNLSVPFSIQSITKYAQKQMPYKQKYEWFTPGQIGFAVKYLLEEFDSKYKVSICNDNTLFLSDISVQRQKVVVLIMARIGLDEPQPEYLKCVLSFMKMKYFFAILGGTPKRAHLFLKHKNEYLGYLDPHTTRPVVKEYSEIGDHLQEYTCKLEWIKQTKIDSSMCIAFIFDRQCLNQFWEQMQKLKEQLKQGFFLYMEKQKPEYDQEAIIQIGDEEDF